MELRIKWQCLYTKYQVQKILQSHNLNNPLPKKGEKLYINYSIADGGLSSFEKSDKKSTYGKPLYLYCIYS